jgi:hypothetical protein
MTHMVDAQRLVATFNDSEDPRLPAMVFSLLNIYFESGPFEFDAGALTRRLYGSKILRHTSPEALITLYPELERFFVSTGEGWRPRPGVLVAE